MSDYTVYIDESGDLGIGTGTRWFVLSAVVVKKSDEPQIRATIGRIRTRLNINNIHLREIRDFLKKGYIVRELSDETFVYMNVIVDTSKFDKTKIPTPVIAYNYICKYLLQRVSWYLMEIGGTADIVLSARGTARDGELIAYIKEKLLPYKGNGIEQEVFEHICAKTAPQWELLQLADVCATGIFLAYEENRYGFTTPCFANCLSEHLYKKDGKINSYGVKFFTNLMKPDVDQLRNTSMCTKKERTPGASTT